MDTVRAAFIEEPQLQARVDEALNDPAQRALIADISEYVESLHRRYADLQSYQPPPNGSSFTPQIKTEGESSPQSKKRKLASRDGPGGHNNTDALWRYGDAFFSAPSISFSLPMRKKLTLEMVSGNGGGLRARDVVKGETEAGMAWQHIDQIFALPVPEKATATTNFVVLPRSDAPSSTEPIIWTVSSTGSPKDWSTNPPSTLTTTSTPIEILTAHLNASLSAFKKHVTAPDPSDFTSTIRPSHLKNAKSHHIKAWKGSKEGFLYPLPQGILFGFRKPLQYFSFSDIESTSYTSVLQRTFNLVISTTSEDIEFAMLDQSDFAPLDAYLRKYGLHDASLAAARRAKADKEVDAEAGGEDKEGELAKAEKELQDQEDEEEEDFEVESGDGDSDGSGSDSEEGSVLDGDS